MEKYKTELEYENNSIIQIFIFRFINSYPSFHYTLFCRANEYVTNPLYCSILITNMFNIYFHEVLSSIILIILLIISLIIIVIVLN